MPQPPRVVSLPTELTFTSNATNKTRENIREHIEVALTGVAVGLGKRPRSYSAEDHPFVSIPNVVLRQMDQLRLEQYASSCRSMCE
jgi:hypothetical protein